MRVDAFDFELPPERIALRPARPRDSARLLVVDDEPRMGRMIRRVLRDLSLNTVCEDDPLRAKDMLARGDAPDMILCDLMMPRKNGFETIQEIRALAPDMPVVAISGFLFGVDHAAMQIGRAHV